MPKTNNMADLPHDLEPVSEDENEERIDEEEEEGEDLLDINGMAE